MAISNFPGGFVNGVTIRDVPITLAHPGKVIFVNNSSVLTPGGIGGSDSNPGTITKPCSTIAGALLLCTASRGDIICVMPGHAETVSAAAGIALNVAGVAIVGLGTGTLRPTITLDTATTATISVTAANITLFNLLIVANYAAIVAAITTTTAKSLTLAKVEFRDTSSVLNFTNIIDTNTTSNDTDGLHLEDCMRIGLGADANSSIIKMDGTNDRLTIKRCHLTHAATTAAGLMPIATGKVVTNVQILDNVMLFTGATDATTGTIITTDGSTNSGIIARNLIQSLDATSEILVTASSGFRFSQNFSSAVADLSGYLLPAADA